MEEAEKRTGQAPMTDLSIREQQLESEEWAGPESDFHLQIPTPDPIASAKEREQCVLSDD
uniref:GG16979 n=1 Tax=Drosophila erecta TaxID=7220 RepID=B3P0Y3_DROER